MSISSELNNSKINNNNEGNKKVKSTIISVILNKAKKEPKTGSSIVAYTHMGVIKKRKDESAQWLEFRFMNTVTDTDEVNEVPCFHVAGKTETQISASALVQKLFVTEEGEDLRFHVDLPEEVIEAFLQSEAKALKVSFDLADITKGKDSAYNDITTQNYHISGASFDILDAYFGVGKRIDKNWILEVLGSLEAKPAGNVVTREELASQSAILSAKNKEGKAAKKKAYKKAESLQNREAAEAVSSDVIISQNNLLDLDD